MSEDDVTAREALAVAQRALAKVVAVERDLTELEDETAALRLQLNEVDQRLSEQEAAAAEDGGEADV
jgi:DNA integrity scanning protein DisA with diadenylate cyclase activity